VKTTLPLLLSLLRALSPHYEDSSVSELIKVLLRNFYSATSSDLPAHLLTDTAKMDEWMKLLKGLLRCYTPSDLPASPEERAKHPYGKVQKWATRCCLRLFKNFGRPMHLSERMWGSGSVPALTEALKVFAKRYLHVHAKEVMECLFMIMKYRHEGGYVYEKVMYPVYQYISLSINYGLLFSAIEPSLDFLLFSSIIPTLSLTEEDVRLWSEDPEEFIRRDTDIVEQFYDAKYMASNVLLQLIKIRTRYTLERLLNWISQSLQKYQQQDQASRSDRTILDKELAIHIFGMMSSILRNIANDPSFSLASLTSSGVKNAVQNILHDHVIADIWSPVGLLRKRAIWAVARYTDHLVLEPEKAACFAEQFTKQLLDPELPCRLEAAKTIAKVVANPSLKDHFRPHLTNILDNLFRLTQDIGSDETVATFNTILGLFEESVAPYAVLLTQKLVAQFDKLHAAMMLEEEGRRSDSLSTLRFMLNTFSTIVDSVSVMPALVIEVENVLMPFIRRYWTKPTGVDFGEEMLQLFGSLSITDDNVSITPQTWEMFPHIVNAYMEWEWLQSLYPEKFVTVVSNFIYYGRNAFYTNAQYVQLSAKVAISLMKSVDLYTLDPICQLFDSLFVNCRGKIDNVYEPLMDSLLMKLEKESKAGEEDCLVFLCSTLSLAVYYNPRIFIKYGLSKSCLEKVLQLWFSKLDVLNWSGKKNAVFGMCTFLELNPTEYPPSLSNEQTFCDFLDKIVDLVIDMNQTALGEDEKADVDGVMVDEKEVDNKFAEADMESREKFKLVDCEKSADYFDQFAFCNSLPNLDDIVLGDTGNFDVGFDLDEAMIETKLSKEDENIALEKGLAELYKNNPQVAQKWSSRLDVTKKRLLSKFLKIARTHIGCMDKRDEQEKKRKAAQRKRLEELLKSNGMTA